MISLVTVAAVILHNFCAWMILPLGDAWLRFLAALIATIAILPAVSNLVLTPELLPVAVLTGLLTGSFWGVCLEWFGLLGEVIDQQRGQTIASSYDVSFHAPPSTLGLVVRQLGLSYLAALGVFPLLLGSSATLLLRLSEVESEQLAWAMIYLQCQLLWEYLALVAPLLVGLLVLDLIVGYVQKVVPAIQPISDGFALKAAVVCIFLFHFPSALFDLSGGIMQVGESYHSAVSAAGPDVTAPSQAPEAQ